MKKTKTKFIASSFQMNTSLSIKHRILDGEFISKSIQAVIENMEQDGYDFFNSESFISLGVSGSYTEGTLLYFQEEE